MIFFKISHLEGRDLQDEDKKTQDFSISTWPIIMQVTTVNLHPNDRFHELLLFKMTRSFEKKLNYEVNVLIFVA